MEEQRGRGPDLRRRRHGTKIDGSPAEEAVQACLEGGGTLQAASDVFREITGNSVSLDTVSRYARGLRAEVERVRQIEAVLGAILRVQGDSPGCDLAALARKFLLFRALEAVRQLPDDAFETASPDRLSLIVSRLERSGAVTDRVRLAARRLERERPAPEPPEEVFRKKLESLASIEAMSQEFLLKERAEKLAAQERAGEAGGS